MELLKEIFPRQATTGIDESQNFHSPLQELEYYVDQSHDEKLAYSFQKFKAALSESENRQNSVIATSTTSSTPVATTLPPSQHCYMAMSSLFTIHVKDISPSNPLPHLNPL